MSATPPTPPQIEPAKPTAKTNEESASLPSEEQPGAQAATAAKVESESQPSPNPDSVRSEETSSKNGWRKFFLLSKRSSQHQALRERIPIEVHDEESLAKKLSYLGPTITSIASIVLTMVVWVSARKLNEQQITLQKEQVEAELADMRSKFFNDLTSTDENKQTLAEIGLAGHGLKAMPVIHLALVVEQGKIRRNAVNVVRMLFQAEMTMEGRQQLIGKLQEEFDSPNKTLHRGVVESLVEISPFMNSNERQQVTKFFLERIPPRGMCSEREGREVVHEAAKFSSVEHVNALAYLLAIAEFPKCGDAWAQAMFKLGGSVEDMSASQRSEVLERMQQVRSEVLKSLREQVSDEDLAFAKRRGFGTFVPIDQVEISFAEFRRKVEEEFNGLIQDLSEQRR